ncbi:hypothetical protein KAU85_04085 [Candidatus Bathyarchaeota archaeon]|nr:hypothetical protein [Candidatus Bathyarchaeota archaeon]
MESNNLYKIAIIFFGFLGAANSIVLAFYLISTNLALSSLLEAEFQFQSYVGSGLVVLCTFLLAHGTYLMLKHRMRKGGVINLGAGIILYSVYLYFTVIPNPKILNWLDPIGFFLFIPPILSGIMGVISKKSLEAHDPT